MVKKRKSILLRLAVCAFIVYIAATLISLQMQINKTQNVLSSLNNQCKAQQSQNDELMRLLSTGNKNEYIERVARDKLNYVKPGERVFVDVSGN